MGFIEFVGITVAIVIGLITYIKWSFKYWERKNVPFVEPTIPFGNTENPLARKYGFGRNMKNIYDNLKSRGCKHGGIYLYTSPKYLPMDPEIIKGILQKDFASFSDRGFYYNETDDPLSAHLFAISGEKWRNLRTKLTPTFSSGKMKMMLNIMLKCSDQMVSAVQENHERKEAVDIKETVACYTTDVIGSSAFGVDCNSFKSPDAPFRMYGKRAFAPSIIQNLRLIVGMVYPQLARLLRIKVLDNDVANFFMNTAKENVLYREANNIDRQDMMKLLINIKNQVSENNTPGLTMEELAAQAFVFFFAGFETSSTTMAFCLYELARNQEIQQRVRDEIHQVLSKYDGKMTYDAIMDLKYMSQVLDETLRKYPILPFITRECVHDYKVPNINLTITKGIGVIIPIIGVHYDAEYYPEPEKFDPERFSEKNRQDIPQFAYMPFGEGPRICIGQRFGLLQAKVGLAALLKNYKFVVNSKTEQPLVLHRNSFLLTTESGIYLDTEEV